MTGMPKMHHTLTVQKCEHCGREFEHLARIRNNPKRFCDRWSCKRERRLK